MSNTEKKSIEEDKILLMQHIGTYEVLIRELGVQIKALSYSMKRKEIESFLLMMISAKNIDLYDILNEQKRQTDKLFCFNKDNDEAFHVLVCINTRVEGSYKFSERLMRHIVLSHGEDVNCMNTEVKGTPDSPDELILDAYNDYLHLRDKSKSKNIQFKTVC